MSGVKTHCHSLPMAANPLPMTANRTGRSLKIRVLQGAASGNSAKRLICVLKQRLTLICSLLRYVWSFHEARRAELASPGQSRQGCIGRTPANEEARSAAAPFPVRVALGLALGLLTAPLTGGPAIAGEWRSFSSVDASTARQTGVRVARAPAPDEWGGFGAQSGWVAMDRFERDRPGKARPDLNRFRLPEGSKLDRLYALIALAESPRAGYDAVHGSARRRPPAKPTALTLGQIKRWIRATPGQHHAIGRFQIIPSTLVALQRRLSLPDGTRFDRATQDRMAALLLADAGYDDVIGGRLPLAGFMDRLAHIWAGLPLASGKSAYHGHAGNRATITRAFYARQMRAIFGPGEAAPRGG
ncbi:glycoside hydrolase family 104 protein [Pukyongiella litopenaei]|uniref:Glycoside hydrolase family 104 protein n=1 Tax=Pukyongiella litopenaei TaxID=2605946 RepID=A0A5C2H433_9RHOB|nr:glycoside hydrolase family 104 protein [Pukyongiella litopenaei]QEP30415.1 glycoside hydrolase family 104 protein [Pukyongiella litopenaei]